MYRLVLGYLCMSVNTDPPSPNGTHWDQFCTTGMTRTQFEANNSMPLCHASLDKPLLWEPVSLLEFQLSLSSLIMLSTKMPRWQSQLTFLPNNSRQLWPCHRKWPECFLTNRVHQQWPGMVSQQPGHWFVYTHCHWLNFNELTNHSMTFMWTFSVCKQLHAWINHQLAADYWRYGKLSTLPWKS